MATDMGIEMLGISGVTLFLSSVLVPGYEASISAVFNFF